MKKIFTLIFFAGCTITASAQGFYHIQNKASERYMIMTDYQKGSTSVQDVDLTAVQTSKNKEKVFTHPGAVCYVTVSAGKCDVIAQNTSIGALTGGRVYPALTKQSDGSYTITGSYSGVTVNIGDKASSGKDDSELLDITVGHERSYWLLHPIDNVETGHFIGVKPDVQTADGTYWTTLLCGFSFTLQSTGMKAFYVDEVSASEFNLKEITGTIPAKTPVLIQCSSNDYTKNIIRPMNPSGEPQSGNMLGGVFYDRTDAYHENAKAYDKSTMRVLSVDANKNLVFHVATADELTKGAYLVHNKAYLGVSNSAAETLTLKGASGISTIEANTQVETSKEGTFNLKGQRVADEPTAPGVYIQNGKKLIIK